MRRKQKDAPRIYIEGSKIYIIRDIWRSSHWREKLLRREFAMLRPNGTLQWRECAEGARFDEIEPFAIVNGIGT